MSARNYQAFSMAITPEMRQQYITTLPPKQSEVITPSMAKGIETVGYVSIAIAIVSLILAIATGGAAWAMVTFFLSLFLGVILAIVGHWSEKDFDTRVRMARFAADNNLTYALVQQDPAYSGMIFSLGHSRKSYNMFRSMTPVPFEIGEYTYTVGSGKNQQTYNFGYAGIALPRRLPHMVLDATKNNAKFFGKRLSNLPVSFDKNQTLSLEGDFNNYFTLYAPKDYERDALYIFSPDVMALMIDHVQDSNNPSSKKPPITLDAEIVDNRLFVYHTAKTNMNDPDTLERFFKIIDTIGAKMHDQSKMYADERIGDRSVDSIAQQGVRLKRKSPIIIVIIFVVLLFLNNFISIASNLGDLFQ